MTLPRSFCNSNSSISGQPSVDLMSLQLGMDCLLSLSDDKVLEKLSNFLFQLAELDQHEVNVSNRIFEIKNELILKSHPILYSV